MQGLKQQPEIKLTPEAEKLLSSGAKALHSAASNHKGLRPSTADRYAFLNLLRYPAVCDEQEAGWLLGTIFEDTVHVLVSAGHLPVLGNPAKNGRKMFSTAFVQQCCTDLDWLGVAIDLILDYHRYRNGREPRHTEFYKKLHRERLKKNKVKSNCQLAKS